MLAPLVLLCLLGACSQPPPADRGGPARVTAGVGETGSEGGEPGEGCDRPYTLVGVVRSDVVRAHERATPDAAVVGSFPRVNAQGAHQVFPLVDETYRADRVWYEALLPVRPNGSTGWIAEDHVRIARSDFRIEVDLDRLRLTLFDRCERLDSYPIGIGTRDTPTPRGTFFLNSLLQPPEPGTVYGAYAFGLSAYSDVITDWEGGGIVGLHGTNDPSSLGREVSHGCIRMSNDAIRFLAETVPLGTVVEIG
jgi:lipoprotein-anchoring transpeptidase ErfK/SrfK